MAEPTPSIIELALQHGVSSYRNRADTSNPAYGFTEEGLQRFADALLASAPHKTAEVPYRALPKPAYPAQFNGHGGEQSSDEGYSAEQMRAYASQAVSAQAPAAVAVPDGWKLVPMVSTEQMEQAAADYLGEYVKASGLWKAMLAATPALPATEDSSAGDLATMTHGEAAAALAINTALHRIRAGKPADAIEPLQHALSALSQAEAQAEPVAKISVYMSSEFGKGEPCEEVSISMIWNAVEKLPLGTHKCYLAPQAQPADAPIAYLQEADQHLLHRFIQTSEDDDSFDIGKDAVKRLANLGVVENCGFGRYGVTMFGYWVHEHFWHQKPSLPLKTFADRDLERRAAMAAAQEGGAA